MIDYEKYDAIKDADEEKSHLCNSLNAEIGTIHRIILYMKNKDIPVFLINLKDLERWADYMERSQNVITYLRKEQEAKTGHWIDTTNTIGFPRCECSECNSEAGAIWMKYCPNCGTKMKVR